MPRREPLTADKVPPVCSKQTAEIASARSGSPALAPGGMGIERADDFEEEEEPEVDLCAQTVRELAEHPLFDGFILFTIFINAVTMVPALTFFPRLYLLRCGRRNH